MPLSAEQVFNELTGEDVKEILMIRFADLLNQVGDFQRHTTLPRVSMSLSIHLEIAGRTPSAMVICDDLIVRTHDQSAISQPIIQDLSAVISADTDTPEGQPPDQIRVEHGIPIMTPQKGPFGMEDVPVVRDGVKYAFNVTQDYGPARERTGGEGPVIAGDIISTKNGGGGHSDVPISKRVQPKE